MIWVYAICERPDLPAPPGHGIAGAPLDGVREGELLAVVSRHAQTPGEPAVDALWAHERVIEGLMADRAVLPMRFGTKLPGEAALREALAARRDEFLAALDRVRGRVEVGVRAMRPGAEEAPVAPASGRDYIEAKLRTGRLVEREAAVLHDPLSALAVEALRRPPRDDGEVLRASYLIESGALARFRGAVDQLQSAHPEVAILCTGPWPPYGFVGGEVQP